MTRTPLPALLLLLVGLGCGAGGGENPASSSGGDTPCSPTTCEAQHSTCGSIADGCGSILSCGACTAPATCGGGGVGNVCGTGSTCTPETNAQFCSRLARWCGSVSALDSCGAPRTVSDCGRCATGATCSAGTCVSDSGGGSVVYVPLAKPSGSASGDWAPGQIVYDGGESMIIKDVLGPDLLAFVRGSSGSLSAAVSQDAGSTWRWVPTGLTLGSGQGAVAQDAKGKVHIIACASWSDPWSYTRIALTRDGDGHVAGFSREAVFSLSTGGYSSSNHAQVLAGADLAGNPVLFYSVHDSSGKVFLGRTRSTKGWQPTSTADFVGLDGSTAITQLTLGSTGLEDSHNSNTQLAQHPGSKDLWLQWGAMDTGDNDTSPVALTRARYVPEVVSGQTIWTLDAKKTVHSGGQPNAQALSMVATPSYVWFLRGGGAGGTAGAGVTGTGLVVDRADAGGAVAYDVFGAAASSSYLGWFALSVDPVTENRAYLVGWVSIDSSASPDTFLVKHWDGAAWQDHSSLERLRNDGWGLARSTGWADGLSVMFVADDMSMYFATLRSK